MGYDLPVNDAVPGAVRQLQQNLRVKGLASAVAAYFSPEEDFAGLPFTCLGSNPRDAVTTSDLLVVSLPCWISPGGQRRSGSWWTTAPRWCRAAIGHPQRCRPVGGI